MTSGHVQVIRRKSRWCEGSNSAHLTPASILLYRQAGTQTMSFGRSRTRCSTLASPVMDSCVILATIVPGRAGNGSGLLISNVDGMKPSIQAISAIVVAGAAAAGDSSVRVHSLRSGRGGLTNPSSLGSPRAPHRKVLAVSGASSRKKKS
eukprot:2614355-Rhodomonas_salina.2